MRLLASLLPILLLAACAVPHAPSVRAASRRVPEAPPLTQGSEAPEQAASRGGADAEALAKQLANPLASLISVPFQFNYDENIGPGDEGERLLINVQPVIPIPLGPDWNLISRTVLPVIDQRDVPSGEDEFGLGDTVESLFFSPVAPTERGWIWGVGPAILLPTSTDDTLGGDLWGLGPTAVALRQAGPWTYGALVNHLWGIAGDDDLGDLNATFIQPFCVYTFPTATTINLNSESTYNWDEDDFAVPINLLSTQVLKLGGQMISVGAGLRYWAGETDTSPEGLGFRVQLVLLFPR